MSAFETTVTAWQRLIQVLLRREHVFIIRVINRQLILDPQPCHLHAKGIWICLGLLGLGPTGEATTLLFDTHSSRIA